MSLFVNEGAASTIPLLPEDVYPAVCVMLVDIGDQYSEAFDKTSRKVIISWELPGEKLDNGETRRLSNTYTASLNAKGNLRKDLISWRGRDFTLDELKKFDLRNVVGAPCLLSVVHKVGKDGQKRAVIGGIMKLPKAVPVPLATVKPVVFDLDDPDAVMLKTSLPDWIQKRIEESETWKSLQAEVEVTAAEQAGKAEDGDQAPEAPELEEAEDEGELPF